MSYTPYMDEMCKGPWPSHAKELKRTRYPIMMYEETNRERYTQPEQKSPFTERVGDGSTGSRG